MRQSNAETARQGNGLIESPIVPILFEQQIHAYRRVHAEIGQVAHCTLPEQRVRQYSRLGALVTIQAGVLLIFIVSSPLPTPQQKVTRVVVLKKEHKMQLLSGETAFKTYTVALGRGGLSPKQREGDHPTPEGLYQIDRRNKNSRFDRALHVSYRNESDRERARKLGVNPGGNIMIHGITSGLGWLGSMHRMNRLDERLHSCD